MHDVTIEQFESLLCNDDPVWSECIYSSPSRRCRTIAAELASRLRIPVRFDSRLLELDFGDWEGQLWSDISANDPIRFQEWCTNWRTLAPPNGESIEQLQGRIGSFFQELPCDTALVVAHAGPIRAMQVALWGLSWDEAMARTIPYATALVIESSGERRGDPQI